MKIGAVEKLVLADTMLREASEEQRLRLEGLMHAVEQHAGSITVVSTEHEAGAKLNALGGVAALLRFPVCRTSGGEDASLSALSLFWRLNSAVEFTRTMQKLQVRIILQPKDLLNLHNLETHFIQEQRPAKTK